MNTPIILILVHIFLTFVLISNLLMILISYHNISVFRLKWGSILVLRGAFYSFRPFLHLPPNNQVAAHIPCRSPRCYHHHACPANRCDHRCTSVSLIDLDAGSKKDCLGGDGASMLSEALEAIATLSGCGGTDFSSSFTGRGGAAYFLGAFDEAPTSPMATSASCVSAFTVSLSLHRISIYH